MDVIWWFTAIAGAIAINLIASELFAWGPRLSESLMRRAVRRLAPAMQERMQEEWAGHLQTIPPGLWRIVAAVGFYLATPQINVALRGARQIEEIVTAMRYREGFARGYRESAAERGEPVNPSDLAAAIAKAEDRRRGVVNRGAIET